MLVENEIRIETPDGLMRTFVAHPAGGGPFPVAVLYMDAPGYREQLKSIASRFAAAGYYLLVPDLFHRFGENVSFDIKKLIEGGPEGPEMKRLFSLIAELKPDVVDQYTQALLDHARSDPAASNGPKACVGYCMGARHVLHAMSAFPDEFAAGSGIHPGVLATDAPDSPHHELEHVRGELYLGLADKDEASAPEVVSALEEEALRHGVSLRTEVHPGTFHGFAVADLPVYDEEASERHFERTLDIWGRNTADEPAATV